MNKKIGAFETLDQVRESVKAGEPVYWRNSGYRVDIDKHGQYFVTFWANRSSTLLTDNYKADQFYVETPIAGIDA